MSILFFFKDFTKTESYFFLYLWNSGTVTFKEQPFFSEGFWNRKSKVLRYIKPRFSFWLKINFRKMASNKNKLWNKKSKVLAQIKPCFSFWLRTGFRKTASNKQVDLRKLENFVKEVKERANFRKPCKDFEIVNEHLTYKGKTGVIFDNGRKLLIPQCHSFLL